MGALVGGIIALILGVIGLIYWFDYFYKALLAVIPISLILGGALATYLGIEEWRDTTRQSEDTSDSASISDPSPAEVEKYKAEAEKYKAELEEMKKAEEPDEEAEETTEEESEKV
ncbi:MAG: hypothetical protein JRD68_09915 [Deltaproteobacteria bacterium]|nr:hypothetical protein [Deltaproteobacteria bacterium]